MHCRLSTRAGRPGHLLQRTTATLPQQLTQCKERCHDCAQMGTPPLSVRQPLSRTPTSTKTALHVCSKHAGQALVLVLGMLF